MSSPINHRRARRVGIAFAVGLACAAIPTAAQAALIDLGTASPFVVLAGSTVTNTGPSVLNGDLGLSPGSAISGFAPGIVNGATHAHDAVALQAQSDLTTAYNAAAGEPADVDLTGTDLGGLVLTKGVYNFSTSAQLTNALTLDAAGDPSARFVFQIGSTLTTASNSSVLLVNGASPCNVFWQIGSSATLGTTTAFEGNLLALTSITLNTGATVVGRALARNGAVTLDSNTLGVPDCAGSTPSTSKPIEAPASRNLVPTRRGTAILRRSPGSPRSHGTPGTPGSACAAGFTASVRGRQIKRVVFRLDGKRVASRSSSPFKVTVHAAAGRHTIRARVTFTDATRAKTLKLAYRACAAAVLRPRRGPSTFTG